MANIFNKHIFAKFCTNSINSIKNYELTANQIIVYTGIYVALICNLPFLFKAAEAITATPDYHSLFLVSVPIFLTCLIIIINSIIGIGILLKPVLVGTIFLSSCLLYATATYGVVFDFNMIQNGFETDVAEASSYLNFNAALFVIVTGLIPASLVLISKLKKQTTLRSIFSRFSLFAVNFSLILLIANFFYADYASVGRNNRSLLAYITPYKFVDASVKYIKLNYLLPPLPFKILDNVPTLNSANTIPQVTILVVGETARAQNFSLNGYAKNTNRFTQPKGVISFSDVSSCGTATAVSLPCMFSRFNRDGYDNRSAKAQQNVLDIAEKAGVDVLWIDNNNGSCKGVCSRVNNIDIDTNSINILCDNEYCLDEALLKPMQQKLNNLESRNTLIVLHMMGSHGPTYFKRYPKDKGYFLPDCQRSDIQYCTEQEIINTYDNTIVYTDYILSRIIDSLETLELTSSTKTSMLYISDHGESLGEKGVYLHGLPYAFAPEEQTHVPMLYWQNHEYNYAHNCVNSIASTSISHDNLFDIVLGVTSVSSSQYNMDNDILADCKTNNAMIARNDDSKNIGIVLNGAN